MGFVKKLKNIYSQVLEIQNLWSILLRKSGSFGPQMSRPNKKKRAFWLSHRSK